MPIFMLNNYINVKLDSVSIPAVREIFGGLGILYLIFHYFVYRWLIADRVNLMVYSE